MDTPRDHECQAIYTVTQVARKLRLSRARFYQLISDGVFPPPAYCPWSRKPMYPSRLLEACIRTRSTGIGFNGQVVRFYAPRKAKKPDSEHAQIAAILREIGVATTRAQVKAALRRVKLPSTGELHADAEVMILWPDGTSHQAGVAIAFSTSNCGQNGPWYWRTNSEFRVLTNCRLLASTA